MAYHLDARLLPGGFVGVDVFFVISGYVVTGSLLRDRVSSLGKYIAEFYGRRFRRILAALLVCLMATTLLTALFIPPSWLSDAVQGTALSAFWGYSNFSLAGASDGYFAPRTEFNPFTHTWSLAVEEQFYLVFPLLLYFSLRSGLRERRPWTVALMAACTVASLLWCVHVTIAAPQDAYYMLSSRYWELSAGAALCIGLQWRAARQVSTGSRTAFLSLGLVLMAVALLQANKLAFPFPWAIPAVVGTLVCIAGLATASTPAGVSVVARVLESRLLTWVGLLSYSLYLWHWPIYVVFRWTVGLNSPVSAVAAFLATFGLAALSYKLIERPVRTSAALSRLRPAALLLLSLAVVTLSWGAAWAAFRGQSLISQSRVVRDASAWYPYPRNRVSTPDKPLCRVDQTPLESEGRRIERFAPTACTAGTSAMHRLFVVGDSHAEAYRRLFHMLSERHGVEVNVYSMGGCPAASLLDTTASFGARCVEFQAWALRDVGHRIRPNDVVFLASLRSVRLGDHWSIFPDEAVDRTLGQAAQPANRAAVEAEAAAIVSRFAAVGAKVLFDAPKPVFRSPPYRCSDWFNERNPVCAAGLEMARAKLEQDRAPVMRSLALLEQGHANVAVWDPLPVLCPGEVCSAMQGRWPLFFDGDHLSGYGNEYLQANFSAVFLRLAAPTGNH